MNAATKILRAELTRLVEAKDLTTLNAMLTANAGAWRTTQLIRLAIRIASKPQSHPTGGDFSFSSREVCNADQA